MEKMTIQAKNISITFPGVKALDQVDLTIYSGEIAAIVGANGAGKSTLMKVLSGANPKYEGEVLLNGQVVELRSPQTAQQHGIQTVFQEVDTALVPTLSVAENIMLNDMVLEGGVKVKWSRIEEEARKALKRLNMDSINVKAQAQSLTLAQKQMVLIARAIRENCNFLILDEPTAPLSNNETRELFNVMRKLKEESDLGIIFISHRLNEVLEICEKYTVMRNGKIVDTKEITPATTSSEIVEKMLGRSLSDTYQKTKVPIGDVIFETKNLSSEAGRLEGINLTVHAGEIVGIAGLVGAGKSELCKTIFGAYPSESEGNSLGGQEIKVHSPSQAVKAGIGLVPEERRKEGVLVHESVSFNLAAATLGKLCSMSFINKDRVKKNADSFVEALGIKTPSIRQKVANLSGGNQQKVAVGKWLAADSLLYIFDEPTKGVDVGAKRDIFKLINNIAANGKGVIYASSENEELLSLADRIYVMYSGKIVAELVAAETSDEEIMYYSVGGPNKNREEIA